MRLAAILALSFPLLAQDAGVEFFEKKIRPVLATRCYACHGPDAKPVRAGLRLDQAGGIRGVITVGKPEESRLISAIQYQDTRLQMPPTGKLPPEVVADFEAWVKMGAPDPRKDSAADSAAAKKGLDLERGRKFWSFQPLRTVNVPKDVQPVDYFLRAKLTEKGLQPAPPTDRLTLLRRLYFDLTGLPPTPEEIQTKEKYEAVVDRLLTSPHYGERWGRHWLDLVRYAETDGHEFDNDKPNAWRYRDYVIQAFNDDVPYNRFVLEHLAGDLLKDRRIVNGVDQSTIATGFYWLGEVINTPVDSAASLADRVDNQIDVLGKTFLGLTVACSRCHDHKFDPIPTADYYALAGFMHSSRPRQAAVAGLARTSPDKASCAGYEWTFSGAALDCQDGRATSGARSLAETGMAISNVFTIPKRFVHVRMAGTSELRLAVDEYRFPPGRKRGKAEMEWKTIDAQMVEGRTAYFELADLEQDGYIEIDKVVFSDKKQPPEDAAEARPPGTEQNTPPPQFALATTDGTPSDIPIYIRGNHKTTGAIQKRRFLTVFSGAQQSVDDGSGRLDLAERMLHDAEPMIARVMVNRIWQHHFGQGIVATPDNFGLTGEPPTHLELLDWLASEFIRSGWSVKHIHRLILTSDAYRMSSRASADVLEKDPRNKLLSRMPVQRLEAESLRDAILAVAGSLDRTMYGPSVPVYVSPFMDGDPRGKPKSGPLDSNGRRSIYVNVRRNYLADSLLAFDWPQPITTIGKRNVSIVPSQALYLMNNEFVKQQAERWASRPGLTVDTMYWEAFGRVPVTSEKTAASAFLKDHSLADLAHVLLMTTEFEFIR